MITASAGTKAATATKIELSTVKTASACSPPQLGCSKSGGTTIMPARKNPAAAQAARYPSSDRIDALIIGRPRAKVPSRDSRRLMPASETMLRDLRWQSAAVFEGDGNPEHVVADRPVDNYQRLLSNERRQ